MHKTVEKSFRSPHGGGDAVLVFVSCVREIDQALDAIWEQKAFASVEVRMWSRFMEVSRAKSTAPTSPASPRRTCDDHGCDGPPDGTRYGLTTDASADNGLTFDCRYETMWSDLTQFAMTSAHAPPR